MLMKKLSLVVFPAPVAPPAGLPVQLCPRHRNPMRVTAPVHSSPLSQYAPDMCTQSFCEYFTSLKFLSAPHYQHQ